MTQEKFTLSAFGDEIADDLDAQLTTLNNLDIGYLDLREAWGTNILHMDDADLARVVEICHAHEIKIGCLGSPIGKSPIMDPIENELNNLRKIMHVGQVVDCCNIRMFSFYPPDTSTNEKYDQYVPESIARLRKLTELAAAEGFTLLLENEKDIVTDTLARSERVIKAVDHPNLRFLWDSANYIQVGESQVVERGWPMVKDYIGAVHIKDAVLADGHVVAAGEGDGQLPLLLTLLKDAGYRGFLTLEPHLKVAGHSTGYSGPELMAYAVKALRKVMADTGCIEVH
ncbi:MAG: TIM barrel protein [Anaerolineae bacterium]|nr:TIM barrel protein [Anaerolineae bacterium]